jgi:hypothetical protein
VCHYLRYYFILFDTKHWIETENSDPLCSEKPSGMSRVDSVGTVRTHAPVSVA